MTMHRIAAAVAIFMFGGLVGHMITLPSSISAEASVAQVTSFELTMKASNLPVQSYDAI